MSSFSKAAPYSRLFGLSVDKFSHLQPAAPNPPVSHCWTSLWDPLPLATWSHLCQDFHLLAPYSKYEIAIAHCPVCLEKTWHQRCLAPFVWYWATYFCTLYTSSFVWRFSSSFFSAKVSWKSSMLSADKSCCTPLAFFFERADNFLTDTVLWRLGPLLLRLWGKLAGEQWPLHLPTADLCVGVSVTLAGNCFDLSLKAKSSVNLHSLATRPRKRG